MHCLKRFLPYIQSKRVRLPLGPSNVGNLILFCRILTFAAIRSRRFINYFRASELLFGTPHTFFTRHQSAVKGALRSPQIGIWSRRGISLTKEESSS